MIQIKPGVRIHMLSPQAVLGLTIVHSQYTAAGGSGPMRLTSVCEGQHLPKSKHYLGHAFDIGLPHGPLDASREFPVEQFLHSCRGALGPDWDCIAEDDHLHFEWDPEGQPI